MSKEINRRFILEALDDKIEHIYHKRKHYPLMVELLCNKGLWVKVKNKSKHSGKYYTNDDYRVWSFEAGHNSTCPRCLVIYGEVISKRTRKTFMNLSRSINIQP